MARLCVVALVACGSSSPPPNNARASAVVSRSRGVAAITVWPQRWPRVQAALAMLQPVVGEDVRLAGPSLWDTLGDLAEGAGLAKPALPPPGVDPAGPVSLEVFAPTESFEITAVALARAFASGQAPTRLPSPRVRLTLTAKDAKALADALRAATSAAGPRVRVVPGDRAVAIDVSFGPPLIEEPEPPAVPMLFDPNRDSAGRAVLRVDGLADLAATTNMVRMALALGTVDAKERPRLLQSGTAELISGYLIIDPTVAVASEVLVDIPDSDEPPRAAFALTDAGVATLTAAGLARGKTARVAELRWSAAIDAAPRSPLIAKVLAEHKDRKGRMTEVAYLFNECGWACFLYVGLGNGFQFATAVDSRELMGSFSTLGAAEATWTDDNLVFVHPAGKPPRGAWMRTPAAAPSPASMCYRKALIAVRAELRDTEHDAKSALDAAAPCMQGDASITARGKAMRDFVGAVKP